MRSDDPILNSALDNPERAHVHGTRLGGKDLSAQIQGWKVERAYNTDLPQAMRAFSGSSSAQLELKLSGTRGVNAPALYSSWAPRATGDVARPRQSVVQTTGLAGTGQVPVFRGTVRQRSAASGSDTVQITALDGAERLRGPAQLPKPYAGFLGKKPIASATWCVDELLRQGGIHSCPPPRGTDADRDPNTALYVSLHGGFTPTYGIPDQVPDPADYGWSRTAAPYELALVPNKTDLEVSWEPRSRMVVPGRSMLMEVTVNNLVGAGDRSKVQLKALLDDAGYGFGLLTATFDFLAGTVTVFSGRLETGQGQSYTWTFPALAAQKGNWHLGVVWDGFSSATSKTDSSGRYAKPLQVVPFVQGPDGTVLTAPLAELGADASLQYLSEVFSFGLVTRVATECVQITTGVGGVGFTAGAFNQQWTKGATLDDVTLPLYSVPSVSGSQWDVISEIAKAALSTAEFDESGVFRWRNHTRFLTTPTRAQRTLTTVRDISSLSISEEIDACRNYCVQPYQDWSAVATQDSEVFRDTKIQSIPAWGSVEIPYSMAAEDPDIWPPLVDCDIVYSAGSAVRFAKSTAANTPAEKGRVETSFRRDGGTLYLLLRNRSDFTMYTVNKDGTPSVRLVMPKPKTEPVVRKAVAQDPTSQQLYGLQQYTADTTDWVQDYNAAVSLATALQTSGAYPVPVFENVEVLYDPRLQLGDVVQLVDTAGASLTTLAWVIGMSVEAGADGSVRQSLTLRGTSWPSGALDTALTPDPPVDPTVWTKQPYSQVTTRYRTFTAIAAAGRSYKDLVTR